MDRSAQLARARNALTDRSVRRRWVRRKVWRYLPRVTQTVRTRDRFGNAVTVSTRDMAVSYYVFVNGTFEPSNLDCLVAVLADHGYVPELVLDVGAHIGSSTLELGSVFPSSRLLSIEPEPGNYRLLCQNVSANGLSDRIQTVNCAVGDSTGSVQMVLNPINYGDHHVARSGEDGGVSVPVRTLSELVEVHGPTVFWIDVQGYEGQVLRGAQPQLFESPVAIEFTPARLRQNGGFEDFIAAARRFPTVLEVTADGLLPAGDLEQRAAELERNGGPVGEDSALDLIMLPW